MLVCYCELKGGKMSSVMETHLQSLLDNHVTLSQSQISQGSTSHSNIRRILANKSSNDTSFPRLLDGDFLSGSYARGTKLHPLDDIDVMIVMDGHGFFPIDEGKHISTHFVRGNNQQANNPISEHTMQNGMIDSRSILNQFRDVLLESFPNSVVVRNGQAVNVRFDTYGLGIDVVPCFHIQAHNSSTHRDMYYIPVGNDEPHWLKTNPKIDEAISTELNDRHNQKLKDIIRLLKYWNKIKNSDRISSYHLETAAWYVFSDHPSSVNTLTEGIRYFFNNGRRYIEGTCPDATRIGLPVDRHLSAENRRLSLAVFDSARKSIASLSGLLPAPINNWKMVFGDRFGN